MQTTPTQSPVTSIAAVSPPSGDRLMTEKEAAEYLAVSVRTLQDKRLRGGGPRFVKLFRSVRYRLSDLDGFIAAATRAHTSEEGRA